MTASAPCSMVSLILSCFSSLREICSDTRTLLIGLECIIVTQEPDHRRARSADRRCVAQVLPFRSKKCRARSRGHRMVLILKYADGLHSLWRGTFAERGAIRRPYKSAVQMLELREDHDRGDQA